MTTTIQPGTVPHVATPTGTVRTRERHHKPGRSPFSPARIGALVILILLAISWLLPIAWAIDTSLKSETDASSATQTWVPPHGFTLAAYWKVLTAGDVPLWIWNSIVVAVAVTAITVILSTLAAYAFSRLDFSGRKWLYAMIIGSIMIPPQVMIIPLFYEIQSFKMIDTYLGIILPQVIAPAMVFILKKFFDQIPVELEDAARVDGAGRLRVFWTIVLPLSRPIIAAVSIFTFIGAWNNFLWPFLVTNNASLMTLPVGLQTVVSAYGIQYAQTMAQAILAALPLIVVFLFFQRQIIRGIATTGFGGA
jgi:multiple sugar transport system permease protein